MGVDKVILLAVILSGAKNLVEILQSPFSFRMTDYEQSSVAAGFKPALNQIGDLF
jgi:hypothetical protein